MKIFIKETDYVNAYHSCLPFYYNSREKQFLKGILGRKNRCIMIKDKFRTLSNITGGDPAQNISAAKSRYPFLEENS